MTRFRLFCRRVSYPGAVLATMLLLAISPVFAQQRGMAPIFSQASRPVNGGGIALLGTNRAMSLDVNIAAFRAAAAPSMQIADVPVAPGVTVDLELTEWNIVAPGAHMVFGTENGDVPIRLTARFYRGKVKGDDQSDVFISFADRGVIGHIRTYDKSYEISTDYGVKQEGGIVPVISYPTDALQNDQGKCGITDENFHEFASPQYYEYEKLEHEKMHESRGAEIAADQVEFSVKGAWEGDAEYAALFSNAEEAADYAAQMIADVSAIYERDVKAQLTIGYMKIWTSKTAPGYPYLETTNMAVALRQVRDYWRLPAQAEPADRAFVHTFSGKAWGNVTGISFVDVLCDKGRSGSLSVITKSNPARDRRCVAHEVGHNFGSPHTNDCSWPGGPLDKCAPAEGGTCFTGTEQSVGTLMGYCSQINMEFHPLTIERMRSRLTAPTSSCIPNARSLMIEPNLVIFSEAQLNVSQDTIITAFFNNTGFGTITVNEVVRSGENNDQFEILQAPTIPFTINAGESLPITVRYKAMSLEPATMTLTYKHDGFNPPVEVTFEGFASDAKPGLAITGADDDEVDWGNRFQGVAYDTTFAVKNFGSTSSANPATLYVTDSRIEGKDKFDFQIIEGIAPFQVRADNNAGVPLTVRFRASDTGMQEAVLIYESNAGGTPGHLDSLPLYGYTSVGPVMQLGLHDLVVDFGDMEQGGAPIEKRYDDFFANVGGALLLYTAALEITEGEPGIFTSTNFGINTELEPGRAHDLNIGFDPTPNDVDASVGLKRGFLWVWSQDESEVTTIGLDTIHFVGSIVEKAGSVLENTEPDEYFYVTSNPMTGNNVSFYLAPRTTERNDLYILSVLDLQGREVHRKVGRFGEQGEFYHVDAADWASGLYYIRVSTTSGIRGRKVNLTK